MLINRDQAQAFLDGINTILTEAGHKYHWDDGAYRTDDGKLVGPADEVMYVSDWTGYLIFAMSDTVNGHNDETFPQSLTINGITVLPDVRDGWECAHYDVEEIYKAWAAEKVTVSYIMPREQAVQVSQVFQNLKLHMTIEPLLEEDP